MEDIIHNGKITAIKNNCVTVSFEKQSACASCDAKHACALHKSQTQRIDINVSNIADYSIGQIVELEISSGTGFVAIAYAYVIPLIIMLSTLFGTWIFTNDELMAATVSLVALIPYYTLLFALRNKFSKKINISIR